MTEPQMKIGDRVRMVHTPCCGTIVDQKLSEIDFTHRWLVSWEPTGTVNDWPETALRPAETDPAGDPRIVELGTLGMSLRKGFTGAALFINGRKQFRDGRPVEMWPANPPGFSIHKRPANG